VSRFYERKREQIRSNKCALEIQSKKEIQSPGIACKIFAIIRFQNFQNDCNLVNANTRNQTPKKCPPNSKNSNIYIIQKNTRLQHSEKTHFFFLLVAIRFSNGSFRSERLQQISPPGTSFVCNQIGADLQFKFSEFEGKDGKIAKWVIKGCGQRVNEKEFGG
jgi:hypothetical protein